VAGHVLQEEHVLVQSAQVDARVAADLLAAAHQAEDLRRDDADHERQEQHEQEDGDPPGDAEAGRSPQQHRR
jgi:hypothetical protein